jgi:hypothetical protein
MMRKEPRTKKAELAEWRHSSNTAYFVRGSLSFTAGASSIS